jgi:hypothetical protein
MSSEYSDRIVSDTKHKYLIQPIIAIASRDFHLYNFLEYMASSDVLKESSSESFRNIMFRAGLIG